MTLYPLDPKVKEIVAVSADRSQYESHMWTVPAREGVECLFGEMVRCSHMSGLSVRCI